MTNSTGGEWWVGAALGLPLLAALCGAVYHIVGWNAAVASWQLARIWGWLS